DKNPNTRGVQLAAHAFGVHLEEPENIGVVKALVAFRTEGLPVEKLKRLEVFVAIAQNEDAATAEAHVVLPAQGVKPAYGKWLAGTIAGWTAFVGFLLFMSWALLALTRLVIWAGDLFTVNWGLSPALGTIVSLLLVLV